MPSWCECEQKMVKPSMCGGCDYMEANMSKLAHSNDETMREIEVRRAHEDGEWVMAEVDRVGTELDNTPHRNNADYVAHFERLLSEALSSAYSRGRLAALTTAEGLARTYPEGDLWNRDGGFTFVAHGLIGKGQDCAALDIATAIQALSENPSPHPMRDEK